jgi:hypothetical protein
LLLYIMNIYGNEDDGGTNGGPGFAIYGEGDYSLRGQRKANARRASCPLSPDLRQSVERRSGEGSLIVSWLCLLEGL